MELQWNDCDQLCFASPERDDGALDTHGQGVPAQGALVGHFNLGIFLEAHFKKTFLHGRRVRIGGGAAAPDADNTRGPAERKISQRNPVAGQR